MDNRTATALTKCVYLLTHVAGVTTDAALSLLQERARAEEVELTEELLQLYTTEVRTVHNSGFDIVGYGDRQPRGYLLSCVFDWAKVAELCVYASEDSCRSATQQWAKRHDLAWPPSHAALMEFPSHLVGLPDIGLLPLAEPAVKHDDAEPNSKDCELFADFILGQHFAVERQMLPKEMGNVEKAKLLIRLRQRFMGPGWRMLESCWRA